MRIAFVHPRFPSADGTGATYSATRIVDGLADAGHDVCVYCPRSPEERPGHENVELRHLSGNSSHPHTDTRLNREILARRDELREYDVVHSYLSPLIPSIAKVGEDSDVGTVVTLNAYGGICAKNDLRHLNRERCRSKSTLKCFNCISRTGFGANDNGYLYQTASQSLSIRLITAGERRLEHVDGFQALSPHVKATYVDFGYPSDRIDIIPNIVDPRFDVERETDFSDPFELLYVGSLQKSKGVDRLVDVFAHVFARCEKDLSLTIVGDGELRADMKQQIEEAGASDAIELTGEVPNSELPDIYASHDVFVYPGVWDEPFGRIFLEAMAAGLPIVATDVGSVDDIIGESGIVTDRSVRALADGLLSVLDQDTLQEHSIAGKRRIDRYRSSVVIPKFERLYASVIERNESETTD
jgi:glycosyltransferase involved in cell wall biosynthesis